MDNLVSMIVADLANSAYYDIFLFIARCVVFIACVAVIFLLFSVFKHFSDVIG